MIGFEMLLLKSARRLQRRATSTKPAFADYPNPGKVPVGGLRSSGPQICLPGSIVAAIFLLACLLPFNIDLATARPLHQTESVTTQRNVTYCTAAGEALKMDLFLPQSSDGPFPVVVYIHGGSWVGGDKFEVGLAGDELARKGYVVAAINYRLGPKHKWPAQIQDTKCAVRYLRASAAQYNLDPNRIAAWGSSAGGHLAALLGLADTSAGFDAGQYLDRSSRVQAVVDMFGPTDLNAYDPDNYSRGIGQSVFGVTHDEPQGRDLLRRASPVTYAGSSSGVPFLILHGDKDSLVPLSQSEALYDRLKAAGTPAELVVVQNGEHGFRPTGGAIKPGIQQIRNMIDGFFDRTLAPPASTPRTFPETGKTVRGTFMRYWSLNGGLAQFGYPISDEIQEASETDGKTYTVQYFERAVFEYHPENKPPYQVLLSPLGTLRYESRRDAAQP
jgi:acetyl esterase/lipase